MLLLHVRVGTGSHGDRGALAPSRARQHHDHGVVVETAQIPEQLDAVSIGKEDVEDQQIESADSGEGLTRPRRR